MCASDRLGGSVRSMRFRASRVTEESKATKVGIAGAAVMAVAFGMARYVYGLTLPEIRADLDVPELLLGLIASGTFIGFLLSLILSTPLTIWKGPRAPTTLGSVCGAAGCALVALASSPSLLAAGALVAGSAAGWVWAPYSNIVAAVAPERDRPRLLAWITTGASTGLILVGPLALASMSWASWRWTWASIAIAAAAAAVLNIRWVPRIPPTPRGLRARQRVVLTRGMLRPIAFAVVLFIAATAYFTYATDAARRGSLGAIAGPVIFVLAGTTGLAGFGAGRMATRVGSRAVAVGALLTLATALLILSLGTKSLFVVLASAVLFGIGNVVGSAVLPIWTAQLVPEHSAAAFTATLVIGTVSSIATPAVIGALTPYTGLTNLLLTAAAVTATTAIALVPGCRTPLARPN